MAAQWGIVTTMAAMAIFTSFFVVDSSAQIIQQQDGEQSRNPCPATCRLELNVGRCSVAMEDSTRWFFNKETNKCESFQYAGCRGNANRFKSKGACREKCGECEHQQNYSLAASSNSNVKRNKTHDFMYPECDCSFNRAGGVRGGCRISVAPPQGWKCQCRKIGLFHCAGLAFECDNEQDLCPENCFSQTCCERGRGLLGNCKGYPTLPPPSRALPTYQALALQNFRNCMHGNGIFPMNIVDMNSNATRWAVVNHQWNLRLPKVDPLAYFIPTNTREVQMGVRCAYRENIPVIPKSGGLSYEGYSFGNQDTIIIDFRQMDHINVNPDGKPEAIVGPGALVGMINQKLWKYGYALPMGNCFTVGIGGHAIGGGQGYFSHMYGLAQESMLEITMVDSAGEIITVNKNQNPKLWWGMHGVGGGYLGIVTEYKFKLFKAAENNFTFARLHYDVILASEILMAWQEWLQWVEANEPKIFSTMFVRGNKPTAISPVGPGFDIQLLHIQDKHIQLNDSKNFVKMLRSIFPKNGEIDITYPNYDDFVRTTGHIPIITPNFTRPYDIDFTNLRKETSLPRYFKEKSFLVNEYISEVGLERIAAEIQKIPDINIWLLINSEGGAIKELRVNDTAYVHRRSLYTISAQYEGTNYPNHVAEGMKWLYEFWNAIQFADSGETYQNYVDRDVRDYLMRFYGTNLPDLLELKRRWDPRDYFKSPVSIPVVRPALINEYTTY